MSAKKGKGSADALTVLPMTFEIVPTDGAEAREWYAAKIRAVCHQSAVAIGKLLIDAKAQMPHGSFLEMIEYDLPFGERTAQYLMVIARNEVLSNPKYSSLLPGTWTVLHELALVDEKLGVGTLEAWIKAGKIHPGIKGREVEDLIDLQDAPQPRADYIAYLRTLLVTECRDELEELCMSVDRFGFPFSLGVVDLGEKERAEEPEPGGNRTVN
jgi:Protein of unknown function (DUF3102)